MRKERFFGMERAAAVDFLARAPVIRLATTGADGAPILRTVNAAVIDDAITFHGAPAGEKTEALGRPAVIQAEETVAQIPSWFVDPERACPATTFYRSVQVHGALEPVDDPVQKARILSALMHKHQPEGRHVPIRADHPLYEKALAGIMVVRVPLERIDGKAKLGQNRTPEERARLVEHLWRRGDDADPRAIDLICAAAPTPPPEFLRAPAGVTLACAPDREDDVRAAVDLLADEYWNRDRFTPDELAVAHRRATAWVCARDAEGRLVASARAISDGAKYAWVYDVVVAEPWRGRGVGTAVVRLLLDHPRVRGARMAWLMTRDAMPMYRKLGFVERAELPPKPYPSTEMVLVRERTA